MARFDEIQLAHAKEIIKPYVKQTHCETFNAKIPLSVLDSNLKLREVKLFHENLMNLCKNLFDNFEFEVVPQRQYVDETNKWTVFMVWLEGEMPKIVKYCLNTFKDNNFNLIIVGVNNVEQYVEIPAYMKDLWHNKTICAANYTDYIKSKLLEKYYAIAFDITTIFVDKIPEYVIANPYWSVKGNYQKNTCPVAMMTYDIGQLYALGGYDNMIYSYVRQLAEYYFKIHRYSFSYYIFYYFYEYIRRINTTVGFELDINPYNNEDCEQLAYLIDAMKDVRSPHKFCQNFGYRDTFFYKLRCSDSYIDKHYEIFDLLIR